MLWKTLNNLDRLILKKIITKPTTSKKSKSLIPKLKSDIGKTIVEINSSGEGYNKIKIDQRPFKKEYFKSSIQFQIIVKYIINYSIDDYQISDNMKQCYFKK